MAMASSLFDLQGKVVLITGAGGGIGAAIARETARCGGRVLVADRNVDAIQDLARTLADAGGAPCVAALRVQDRKSCLEVARGAVNRFSRIDVLINCAGVNTRMRPEAYSEEVWDDIIDINLKGTFNMCQAVFPVMEAQGGGKIVNIGSILSLVSNAMTAPYSASKGGVLQLTRALACAWAGQRINVNAILPGWIDTPLSRQARVDIPGHAERVVETTPMRRWGTPEDIVGAALFLSSAAADFVTGASLVVDGGVTAHV